MSIEFEETILDANKDDFDKTLEKELELNNQITTFDVTSIYEKIYNIDIIKIKKLEFKN